MNGMDVARRVAKWGGWAAVAFVGFVTLSPIGLRPVVAGMSLEHLGAFGVIGFLLAFAYPRSLPAIAVLTVGTAVLLELAQTIVPGRHGRLEDAALKICGALLGIALAWALNRMRPAPRS